MDNQIFALELNGLAGQAQALADAAKEGGNDAELLTRDLHDTQRAFQRLIESSGSICGFALEPHLPVIRDVSFHVAAARYSLSSLRTARHDLVKGMRC